MARSRTSVFDTQVVEDARQSVPQPRLSRWAKTFRLYVWCAIFLFPLSLLAIVLVVVKSPSAAKSGSADAAATATSSPGRTAATRELLAWLRATPAPLPGGTLLSWDKADTLPAHPTAHGIGAVDVTYRTEIDYFTLMDGKGATFTAAVQVALDPRGGGAVALGGPSLAATVPPAGDSWTGGGPWPGLTTGSTASPAVLAAITGWANAYTSGSADSLRLAVGDTNSGHSYLPLSGATGVTVTPTALASPGPAGAMIAQVTLAITWAGQHASQAAQPNSTTPMTTMDLLIERADTAAPVITAWGPPGSGPTLRDYQNALTATGITLPSATPSN
jgi:hypothetical protein